jgi:hypothetical protein
MHALGSEAFNGQKKYGHYDPTRKLCYWHAAHSVDASNLQMISQRSDIVKFITVTSARQVHANYCSFRGPELF